MKKINLTLLYLFLFLGMVCAQEKIFSLDDLMSHGKTAGQSRAKNFQTTWWGNTPLQVSRDSIFVLKKDGSKERLLFSQKDINTWLGKDLVKQCSQVQFPYATEPIAKIEGKEYITLVDFETKQVIWTAELYEGASQVSWDPVSRNMAYCVGSNVYVQLANGTQWQLTHDGNDDIVYGQAVSRNEFGIDGGLFWSPNGKRLAFYKKDQSRIPSYPQVDITQRTAAIYTDKYPMAGTASEQVYVYIFDVETAQTIMLKNDKPAEDYMTNLSWSPDSKRLYVFELNRDQDHMQLFGYDAITGEKDTAPLLEEKHPCYVEPSHPLSFLPWDNTKAVMQTKRDNWNHLWLIDLSKTQQGNWCAAEGGGEIRDNIKTILLTSGDYEVKDFIGYNTRKKSIIFTANATHPLKATIHSIDINGKKTRILGEDDGVHHATLSVDGSYLIDRYTSPTIPRKVNIIDCNKGNMANLFTAENPWKEYNTPEITSGSIKADDGVTDLYYRLVKPINFNPNNKYPTIVYVYGGPHAHNVEAAWGYYYRPWEIFMAQKGYVVFVLDNRGSEYRGLKFENVTHRHLGEEEMKDQMCGVNFLKTLSYVDSSRLGVHGWSYGGFMTTNLMCSYPDVFKVGVAGGPVIDWKYYEIMYGERYMDRPEQNPAGYTNCNLVNKAKNLKGKLQIIIGYNDPICVPQHTLSFIRASIDAGTQPDLFMYPGQEHNMIGIDMVHLHERITQYFEEHLK